MIVYLWLWLWFPFMCLANTETYMIRIPHYFNIPQHPNEYSGREIRQINTTYSLLQEYPVQSMEHMKYDNIVRLKHDTTEETHKVLLVRVNNYGDQTYGSDDMLSVKLCWPATEPYEFSLSHKFVKQNSLGETKDAKGNAYEDVEEADLHLYLQIEYYFNAYTYNSDLLGEEELAFQLYLTKLPVSWLPIPAELYKFIVYFVDLAVIVVALTPYLRSYIFE